MTSLYCITTQDAEHTDVSPLGYRETLVEINGLGSFAQLQLDIDDKYFRLLNL